MTTQPASNDFKTAIAQMAPEDLGTLYALTAHSIAQDATELAHPGTITDPHLAARTPAEAAAHALTDLDALATLTELLETLSPRDRAQVENARSVMSEHLAQN